MEAALGCIGWFLSITAVIGNSFVIILVALSRRLHSNANWFVLSLAVADTIIGFTIFPPAYFCTAEKCNMNMITAFFWFSLHSSVSNLCALTCDRYIAIVHPLKYNASFTKRHPGLVIMTTWLLAFTISSSNLVTKYVTKSDTIQKGLFFITVPACLLLSCVLLFYAVIRIIVVAHQQKQQEVVIQIQLRCNQLSSVGEDNALCRRRNKNNSAPFIIAVVFFFLGCYLTVNILILCINFSCDVSERTGNVVTILLILNSTVNPLVYACSKKDVKRELAILIRKWKIKLNSSI
ncbi:adenosine receptor A3-like [Stylophora pistillata]|uniref:adenosine receptor A3-like n=1 Tax=Stylophora pistillata TaxID=50429 RepID=UPI000C04A5AA|nr:adenosine receptor A3-like [Stylophora pistillata]